MGAYVFLPLLCPFTPMYPELQRPLYIATKFALPLNKLEWNQHCGPKESFSDGN